MTSWYILIWVCYQKYLIADKKIAPLGYGTRSVAHYREYPTEERARNSVSRYCKCEEPYTFGEPDIRIFEVKRAVEP